MDLSGFNSGRGNGGMNMGMGGKKSSGFVMVVIIAIITVVFNVGTIAKPKNKKSTEPTDTIIKKETESDKPKKVEETKQTEVATKDSEEEVTKESEVTEPSETVNTSNGDKEKLIMTNSILTGDMIPDYNGTDKNLSVNGGFADFEIDTVFGDNPYESGWTRLTELDEFGRVGVATAFITPEYVRGNDDGSNSQKFKPTGWNNNKIDNKNVYTRTHLIGYNLSKDNMDVKENLFTGTGMIDSSSEWGLKKYEDMILSTVNKGNSVLYEIRPIFKGNELVARGIQLRAISYGSEDLDFNVFIYNVQDNFTINYKDGSIKK